MSRNGSGTFTQLGQLAPPGTQSNSTNINNIMSDYTTEMTDSLSRSGKGGMLAALAMGNNKITGVADGALATDVPSLKQVQSDIAKQATAVAGTADAITLSFTPTLTALTAGMKIRWLSAGANTVTAPTVNCDTLGAITIKKGAAAALAAGDLGAAGQINEAVYDGTQFLIVSPTPVNLTGYAQLASPNTFTAAQTFNRAMNFNEAGLTVTAGTTAWDMTTQGPDVNIGLTTANNLTIANPTAFPTGPARGTIRMVNTSGAVRTISWGTSFLALSGTLPSVFPVSQQLVFRYWTQGTSVYIVGVDFVNAAGGLVQLDSSAKLPAVDGSQLTNLPSQQPKAQTGAGVGQFVALGPVGSGSTLSLPASGTWLYYVTATGTGTNQSAAGIAAGGTAVLMANSGTSASGWAWRMT